FGFRKEKAEGGSGESWIIEGNVTHVPLDVVNQGGELFSSSVFVQLPDLKDAEAVQKFFLEEIQLGEELLAQGDYERGVDHLTNAIAVCGQPQQLLQVLQQTLPPPVFQMLLTKLPTISQRIVSAQSVSDDDIE
uniref:Translocase of outer mitochondrial membrane 20b n=1 Tax=Cyprinus carpio carpio TaxID=630221 RepID=A0A9J8A0C0_CYPCA